MAKENKLCNHEIAQIQIANNFPYRFGIGVGRKVD
jgi:hypothetical protein